MADKTTKKLAKNIAELIANEAECEEILSHEGREWLSGVVTEAPPAMAARGAFLMCQNGVWYEVTITPANK